MGVLVTGGAGYIGSVTAKALLEADHAVLIYDNLSTGHREAVPEGAVFLEGDLQDEKRLGDILANNAIDAVRTSPTEAEVDGSARSLPQGEILGGLIQA